MKKQVKKSPKTQKDTKKDVVKKNPLVDENGQPLIGVKTEKLSDGEIEGFDPIIKEG